MAIKQSGSLSFSEIASEFEDTAPHSMSEFVRGGSLVPDSPSNSNIPTTAANMRFNHFFGGTRGLSQVITATSTNVNLETLFGSTDWASTTPKFVTIDSGVTVGATSTGNAALTVPSGMGGTLTIVNNGSIEGAGGAANGGNGGNAILVSVAGVTITNNGTIYAGGGGGGRGGAGGDGGDGGTGGTGGQGSVSSTSAVIQGSAGFGFFGCGYQCRQAYGSSAYCYSGCNQINNQYRCSSCAINQTTTTYTSGGAGGAGGSGGFPGVGGIGGVGRGYNQSAGAGGSGATGLAGGSGSAGSAGGTNAGTGGTGGQGGQGGTAGNGGAGGDWGESGSNGLDGSAGSNGSTGNAGSNGNYTNGSAGSAGDSGLAGDSGDAGGAAGYYISGISNVSFTNNGTVAGGTN